MSGVSSRSKNSSSSTRSVLHNMNNCPRCLTPYDYIRRVGRGNYSSKIPLILNCKHTVCEECIASYVCQSSFTCPICKENSPVPKDYMERLSELFVPHLMLIGSLVWKKNYNSLSNCNKPSGFVPTGVTLKSKHNLNDISSALPEMSQQLESTESDDDSECSDRTIIDFCYDRCSQHSQGYKNIKCITCDSQECAYCFLEDHQGHKALHLYKLTDGDGEKLKKVRETSTRILKQLRISKLKLQQIKCCDTSQTESEISSYFMNFHGRLLLIEKQLKKNLKTMNVSNVGLDAINVDLKSAMKRVVQFLACLDILDPKEVDAHAILREYEDLLDIPSVLICDNDATNQLDPIQFIPDRVFEHLDEMFELKQSSNVKYSLIAKSVYDLDVDGSIENEIHGDERLSNLSATGSSTFLRSSYDNTKPKKRISNKSTVDKEDFVTVLQINDSNSFYVQKCSNLRALHYLNARLGRLRKVNVDVEDLRIGSIYCVEFVTKHYTGWRRAKLVGIVRKKSTDEPRYQMRSIDYGNCQLVTRGRIKMIGGEFLSEEPFALHCQLHNPHGNGWSKDVSSRFCQIVKQGDVTMKVLEKLTVNDERHHVVELRVRNRQGDRILVAHLLPEVRPSSVSTPTEDIGSVICLVPSNGPKLYGNSARLEIGQSENVAINFVENPDHVCLQLEQNIGPLDEMTSTMTKFYDVPGKACLPVDGTNVAVEIDGKWLRASVTAVDSEARTAQVYLVDSGIPDNIPWERVRPLAEQFSRIECQAIIVGLADVAPVDDSHWSDAAIKLLTSQLFDNNYNARFRIVVSQVEPLKVALFKCTESGEVCVNALLVHNQVAESIGEISKTVMWHRDLALEELGDDNLTSQLIKKSEEILKRDEDLIWTTNMKSAITVVRCDSPDLIYFKFNSNNQKEDKLHGDLKVCYSDARKNRSDWKVGEKCVIWWQKKGYARAVIKGKLKRSIYRVYLYDQGEEMTIKEEFIYQYDKYFDSANYHPSFIYKCQLANIKAAGGDGGKWSKLSVDVLQKIFATYKTIYIVKAGGEVEDKLMNVLMCYALITPGSALEPSQITYISINRTLIECGVAFKYVTTNVKSDSCTDLNSDRSVQIPVSSSAGDRIDWNDIVLEADPESARNTVTTWPDLNPIQEASFNAHLICIDTMGNFWIRTDDMQLLYEEMEKKMADCFEGNDTLASTDENEWNPGEMCTMLCDGSWYRGTVNHVTSERIIRVIMIDFGSEHEIPIEDLHKEIMYPDIAPFVVSVQLFNVASMMDDNEWGTNDVAILLENVTNRIRIDIVSNVEGEVPKAMIYLVDDTNLNDLAAEICPNLRRLDEKLKKQKHESKKSIVSDLKETNRSESKENCDEDFVYSQKLELNCAGVPMVVSDVIKYNSVVLNCFDDDRLNADTKSLSILTDEIEAAFDTLPRLREVVVGQRCIGPNRHSVARGLITNVDNVEHGFVSIFFVDYGVTDMVSLDLVKEMKNIWLEFPVNYYSVSIAIKATKECHCELILHQMKQLKGQIVSVRLVSDGPTKIVDLYDDNKLYYDSFIKSGILLRIV